MNKTYQELCDEVAMLREQLADAQTSLEQALELGEEASSRHQELKENRPAEIADAVMRARREWAAQADPDYLRERDARVTVELRDALAPFAAAWERRRPHGDSESRAYRRRIERALGPFHTGSDSEEAPLTGEHLRRAHDLLKDETSAGSGRCPDGLSCDYSRKGGNCGDPLCQSAGGEA